MRTDKLEKFADSKSKDKGSSKSLYRHYLDEILFLRDKGLSVTAIFEYLESETDINEKSKGMTYRVISKNVKGYKVGDDAPLVPSVTGLRNFVYRIEKEIEQKNAKQAKEVYIVQQGKQVKLSESSDGEVKKPASETKSKTTRSTTPQKAKKKASNPNVVTSKYVTTKEDDEDKKRKAEEALSF